MDIVADRRSPGMPLYEIPIERIGPVGVPAAEPKYFFPGHATKINQSGGRTKEIPD